MEIIRRRRNTRPRTRWSYNPSKHSRQQTLDSLKPLDEVSGKRELKARKLLVFNEAGLIVLSIVSTQGTVTFPLSRQSAADLSGVLAKRLAEAEPV